MIRSGMLQEALPVIQRGLLPRAVNAARFLSRNALTTCGVLHRACLLEIAAAVIPVIVSGFAKLSS